MRHPEGKLYGPREPLLRRAEKRVSTYIADCCTHGASVLDISCGNGAMLEVLRARGCRIMGTEIQYFDLLDAADIPYIKHDSNNLPLPFADRSWDVVTCVGSITFYKPPWGPILDEFFRIARKAVFISANAGPKLNASGEALSVVPRGWSKSINTHTKHRWDKSNG